jgi:hypothetical protein
MFSNLAGGMVAAPEPRYAMMVFSSPRNLPTRFLRGAHKMRKRRFACTRPE